MKIRERDRAMDKLGQTGTVKRISGNTLAFILYDTQRPSSQPKPIPLKELRFIRRPERG